MPLTPAHPAIVLPLRKVSPKWVSVSGLVIGSMSPDFEYLLTFHLQDKIGHSLIGILQFCLPVSFLVYCCYHGIIRNKLILNLPVFLKSRFLTVRAFDWQEYLKKRWYVVIYSIMIGAFSHLFWDAFTHEHRFFVEHLSFLRSQIGRFPVYKLLQHLSTLSGLMYIGFLIWKLPVSGSRPSPGIFTYWLIVAGVVALVFLVRFNFGLSLQQFGNGVVTLFSALFLGLLTASVTSLFLDKRSG